jgi:hypothetical protein
LLREKQEERWQERLQRNERRDRWCEESELMGELLFTLGEGGDLKSERSGDQQRMKYRSTTMEP